LFSIRTIAGAFLYRHQFFSRSLSARSCVLLLISVFTVAAAFGQGSPIDEPKNTIRGTVINELTQAPIPRALVYSGDNRYATMTDGEGHFEFTLLKPSHDSGTDVSSRVVAFVGPGSPAYNFQSNRDQTLMLFARKPGFLDDPRYRHETLALTGNDVTIALLPEGLIKGRVTLSTGEPGTSVTVQLSYRQVVDGLPRWTSSSSARVHSSGEFRFSDLRPGSDKLSTLESIDNDPLTTIPGGQRYGFPPVYFPGVSDFNSATTIEVAAGSTAQVDLSLVRQPYYDVKIPVAGSEINGGVSLWVRGQRGPGYSLAYNNGRQRIEGMLPNGIYTIDARTFGANSISGSVSLKVAGGPAIGTAMTMVPSSSISFDVKEEFTETRTPISATWSDGQHSYSLRGARLYLQARAENADDAEGIQGGGSTPPPAGPNDDSVVIENLLPGRYWLRLTTSRGYVASATSGGVDVLHEPITVAAASSISVDVTMRDDGGKIEGTIPTIAQSSASSDSPQSRLRPRVWVYCVPRSNNAGQLQILGVTGEGKFTSPALAPGDYLVLAFAEQQPFLPYRDAESMKAYESKGQPVHLSAGQTANVQVQVIPGSE